ncbi:MAG TPA: MazG nucleotide pyrophosphohydrolase domain-containing protein [Symbiobacteriaceae bacterium]
MSENITLRDLQAYLKAKDFRPELKHAYFLKLIEEVGELAEVVRKDRRLSSSDTIKGTIEEELYDVLYYTLSLANVYDIDLTQCFRLKDELNRKKWDHAAGPE